MGLSHQHGGGDFPRPSGRGVVASIPIEQPRALLMFSRPLREGNQYWIVSCATHVMISPPSSEVLYERKYTRNNVTSFLISERYSTGISTRWDTWRLCMATSLMSTLSILGERNVLSRVDATTRWVLTTKLASSRGLSSVGLQADHCLLHRAIRHFCQDNTCR